MHMHFFLLREIIRPEDYVIADSDQQDQQMEVEYSKEGGKPVKEEFEEEVAVIHLFSLLIRVMTSLFTNKIAGNDGMPYKVPLHHHHSTGECENPLHRFRRKVRRRIDEEAHRRHEAQTNNCRSRIFRIVQTSVQFMPLFG